MEKLIGLCVVLVLNVLNVLKVPNVTNYTNLANLANVPGGQSLWLTGSSYASVPHAAFPAIGGGEIALEAWIYPVNTSGCRAVFGKDYLSGLWFGLCGGYPRFHRGSAGYVQASMSVPANTWTHLYVESWFDPYDNRYYASFYVNGESDGVYGLTGDGAIGGTRDLRIGNDQSWDYFAGSIAEARLWTSIRYYESAIRNDMHTALDEKRPGLAAVWHLTGDFNDSIGTMHGTGVGGPAFVGYVSPAQPPTSPVDAFFNALPQPLHGAATAYVPRLNRALLIGGYRGGAPSALITAVDAGSGASANLGTLPAALGLMSAAYAESNDTVYAFGGSPDTADATVDTIYAIDPATGAARLVAASLPRSLYIAAVVYSPRADKILIAGGYRLPEGALSDAHVFDVATETISPAGFALPQPLHGAAAAYSSATGKIYLLGGANLAASYDAIVEITLNADGSGGASALPAPLPLAAARASAVEDGATKLIYVMAGNLPRVLAFDPLTGESWLTPVELPKTFVETAIPRTSPAQSKARPYSSVVYSPLNRHALVMGGDTFGGPGNTNVWRIPLGDGPLAQLGRWDLLDFGGPSVQDIEGDTSNVLFGMTNGTYQYYDYGSAAPGTQWFNTGNTRAVAWDTVNLFPFMSGGSSVYMGWSSGALTTIYNGGGDTTSNVLAMDMAPNKLPLIARVGKVGGQTGPGVASLLAPSGSTSSFTYQGFPPSCALATDMRFRGAFVSGLTLISDYWALTSSISCGQRMPDGPATPAPTQADDMPGEAPLQPGEPPAQTGEAPDAAPQAAQYTTVNLRQLRYTHLLGTWSAQDLGPVCNASLIGPTRLAFARNGDLWITGSGGVCRYPAANLPGSASPQPTVYDLPYAVNSTDVTVDGDGRIWVSTDGGLSGFETRRDPSVNLNLLRAVDFTRLNAPIGSRAGSSALSTVAAVGEKVYAARGSRVFTYAPRWQQLGLSVKRLWTARGRLFAASDAALHVLQPDGVTWDVRPYSGVRDVEVDRAGRAWVAADGGAPLYVKDGWGFAPGMENVNEAAYALAEDARGRMWVGLRDGVLMYDRERVVARLTPPTGPISVTQLLADRDGNVWAGTNNGLARFNAADASWTLFNTALFTIPSLNASANVITDIAQRGDGRVYISTGDGVFFLAPGAAAFARVPGSVAPQPLAVDELGRVWSGNSVESGSSWQWHYWTNSGIRSSLVSDVAADRADRVWFAHPGGGISLRGSFLPAFPDEVLDVASLSAYQGSANAEIVVYGQGFGSDPAALRVTFGGELVEVRNASGTQMTVRLNASNRSGDVTVRRGARGVVKSGAAGAPYFCAVPVIRSFTPTGGTPGTDVTVIGANFDAEATIALGGPARAAWVRSPTLIEARIAGGDATGDVTVANRCAGRAVSAAGFRKHSLALLDFRLNQGLASQDLFGGKPTLVSAWLAASAGVRGTDQLSATRLAVSQRTPAGWSEVKSIDLRGQALPTGPAPQYNALGTAVNAPNAFFSAGRRDVKVELWNNGALLSSMARPADLGQPSALRVLLVPFMPAGYTSRDLSDMRAIVDAQLPHAARALPDLRLDVEWSPEVQAISGQIDLSADLKDYARTLDHIRARRNKGRNTTFGHVMGVVSSALNSNASVAGKAYRPTTSELLNSALVEDGCWVGKDIISTLTFGLIDPECMVYFTGWLQADAIAGKTLAHELGHTLGLVDGDAANGNDGDNEGHSFNDETDGGNCSGTFQPAKTLYRLPGVQEPIVDPISGQQLAAQMTLTQTAVRGKAIMSYACQRNNDNSFFEPADVAWLRGEMFPILGKVLYPAQRAADGAADGPAAAQDPRAPAIPAGQRLYVNGVITESATGAAGAIRSVEALGSQRQRGLPFLTGYALAQRNAAGAVISRTGVLPFFDEIDEAGGPEAQSGQAAPRTGAFFAVLEMAPGATRVDLMKGGAVLSTYAAGPAAPAVSIQSPSGGAFNAGSLPIQWTAGDADGDRLQVAIDYSADGGATWQPLGSAAGSGAANGALSVPVEQLAGSANARVRVSASDGFRLSSAVSAAFSVARQRPQVTIVQPLTGVSALEGAPISLSGLAFDAVDGQITATSRLTWESSLYGVLGHGADIAPALFSVGRHAITLTARNSAGLAASGSLALTVRADYDGDGLSDAAEANLRLNALTPADALGDADGDGLPLRVELQLGTQPGNPDSDGDGAPDGAEVAAGRSPLIAGDALPPNALIVSPAAISLTVDLARDVMLPQQFVQVSSRAPATWTLAVDRAWMTAGTVSGTAPGQATLIFSPIQLREGAQTGRVTVSSPGLGSVSVPVTVTAVNKRQFCDVNGDGAADARDVAAVQALAGAAFGGAAYDHRADLDRDGAIGAADVALARACLAEWPRRTFLPLTARGS